MWLEAILTREDLLDAFCKLAPLEIRFGQSGSLNLSAPTAVRMNPGRSVAVTCDAALHVPFLGMNVPVHMHGLTVELLVSVHDATGERAAGAQGAQGAEAHEAEHGHGRVLHLGLQIDRTGVAHLPHFLDEGVTKMVNEELAKKQVGFTWNFHDTLTRSFPAPAALATLTKLGLRVRGGRVRITDDALGLAIGFDSEVEKRAAA